MPQKAAERPLSRQEVECITNGLIGPKFCVCDITTSILLKRKMMPEMFPHVCTDGK